MEPSKVLAKIARISVGYGGYQDALFGVSLTFTGLEISATTFEGFWSTDHQPTENTKWDEEYRTVKFAEVMRLLNGWCRLAKKTTVDQLHNTPVELTFEGGMLRSWRILTEVL